VLLAPPLLIKGVASPVVVVGTATVVDFSHHTLALTLAFAAIVGGGDRE
jgi:hypothetical protein